MVSGRFSSSRDNAAIIAVLQFPPVWNIEKTIESNYVKQSGKVI